MPLVRDPLVETVIGLAIAVHREVGLGLYERVYAQCLGEELDLAGIRFQAEVPVPLKYKRLNFPVAFRADLLVEDRLLIELKAVEKLTAAHEAQVLTYLRLSGVRQALLINFNVPLLKQGLKSYLNPKSSVVSSLP